MLSAAPCRRYADTASTETRCGYNPLLEDFANTAFLLTGAENSDDAAIQAALAEAARSKWWWSRS